MKRLLFVLLCVVLTTSAFSQVKVRPGVKLGLNMAKLSNLEQTKRKLGVNGGLFVNVHLSHFYELQVETTYSNQGTTFKYQSPNQLDSYIFYNNEENLNLEYISLAVANKFFPNRNTGFNIIIGPAIDILISKNNYNTYTPIDFSIFGGIGYEFPYGLSLEMRYKQGLLDIRDSYYDYNNGDNYYNDNTILNGVIQLGITYKFGI